MTADAQLPLTPPYTPHPKHGETQPTLPADALADRIRALEIPTWGNDDELPSAIIEAFPITPESLYTAPLLQSFWDTGIPPYLFTLCA